MNTEEKARELLELEKAKSADLADMCHGYAPEIAQAHLELKQENAKLREELSLVNLAHAESLSAGREMWNFLGDSCGIEFPSKAHIYDEFSLRKVSAELFSKHRALFERTEQEGE
jgi:hypothetical protein